VKRPGRRRREYNERFKRPDWAEIRVDVLKRDGGLCQVRLNVCTVKATQAHHTTYEHFGHGGDLERRDCVAACKECNREERVCRITRHVLGS
jgi:5-methylcytosine-specific restriction endonuclease McrA